MATFIQPGDPQENQPGLANGDIWVRSTDGFRQIWNSAFTMWQRPATAPWLTGRTVETTEVPPQGTADRHLAKLTAANWNTVWVDPAQGILFSGEITTGAGTTVSVSHGLRTFFVDVQVFVPGAVNPLTEQRVIIPQVDYVDNMGCVLKFAEPVTGTVVMRK